MSALTANMARLILGQMRNQSESDCDMLISVDQAHVLGIDTSNHPNGAIVRVKKGGWDYLVCDPEGEVIKIMEAAQCSL